MVHGGSKLAHECPILATAWEQQFPAQPVPPHLPHVFAQHCSFSLSSSPVAHEGSAEFAIATYPRMISAMLLQTHILLLQRCIFVCTFVSLGNAICRNRNCGEFEGPLLGSHWPCNHTHCPCSHTHLAQRCAWVPQSQSPAAPAAPAGREARGEALLRALRCVKHGTATQPLHTSRSALHGARSDSAPCPL
jgi:hypothetical protein